MRRVNYSTGWCVVLLLSAQLVIQAQSKSRVDIETVFNSMHQSIQNLRPKFATQEMSVEGRLFEEKLSEVTGYINKLHRAANQSPAATPPQTYLDSLTMNSMLLESLAKSGVSKERALKGVNEVASALKLKVEYLDAARGNPFDLVRVVVHTVKGSEEVGGYEIWYVLRGFADSPGTKWHKRFNRLSSPSAMELAPGNYLIWAVKNDVASGQRPLTVGEGGASKCETDLPVK